MRSLILAIQFLTRLPTPQLPDFNKDELPNTAPWFPVVGGVVGAFIGASMIIASKIDPWLGALTGVIMWIWITGALHLDGLADLADALGAAHRDSQRFLQVMRDPHVGTFGVVSLIAVIASKLILFYIWISHDLAYWIALPLVCAWSRLGAIAWSAWLPSLHSGMGETFTWHTSKTFIIVSAIVLFGLSLWLSPVLLIAPLVLGIWWMFLKHRVGGMTGDCLGAGIEFAETLTLALASCLQYFIHLMI